MRNIEVRNVTSQKSNYGLLLRGYPHAPVSDIRLRDCTFDNVARADIMENVQRISLRECEDQRQSSQPECYSMKLWR